MKRFSLLVISLLTCSIGAFAQAAAAPAQKPAATPTEPPTIASILNRQVSSLERQFVPLADAMPEDKYHFAPTNGEFKGVRDFSYMVKHVAVTNTLVTGAMLEEQPPTLTDEEKENGPVALKTKAESMQYLKDSFAKLHKAVEAITEKDLISQ